MNKKAITILAIVLAFSLGFNIYQGVLLNQEKQEEQHFLEELCRTFAVRCSYTARRLDTAIQDSDRKLVHSAGEVLKILDVELHTHEVRSYGVIENYQISYLGEILTRGDPSRNIAAIGHLNDNTAFADWEIQALQKISQALKDCAQVLFKDSNVTNFQKAELKPKCLETLNQALADFEKATSPLFDQK